jgi:glycerate 2-kinase
LVRSETVTLTRPLNDLRQDLLAIVRAGIRAVDAAELTRQALAKKGSDPFLLNDANKGFDPFFRCIAAGKAALPMAKGASSILRDRLRAGLIVAPVAEPFGSFESIAGGHPVPDEGSERAGRRALEVAESVASDETLLVLLSGGASALMAVPAAGISLDDKRGTTAQMLRGGADIQALNTVRKHLSAIKGGWLASRAAGPVLTYAISDVVGDDVSVIGSGPTVADPSTFADARALLDRYGGALAYPDAVVARLERGARGEVPETPKPVYPRLVKSDVHVIGSRGGAMFGAAAKAVGLGYHVVRLDGPVVGEARDAATAHLQAVAATAREQSRPLCVISSGETTVTVTGSGKGGRNQEFALAAVTHEPGFDTYALASLGTDGIDGPTDAAGAIVDSTTLARARAAELMPDKFLHNHDSYAFFAALGDLIHTGPTGTNVGDLQVILLA